MSDETVEEPTVDERLRQAIAMLELIYWGDERPRRVPIGRVLGQLHLVQDQVRRERNRKRQS